MPRAGSGPTEGGEELAFVDARSRFYRATSMPSLVGRMTSDNVERPFGEDVGHRRRQCRG